jgi:hypothetical protein
MNENLMKNCFRTNVPFTGQHAQGVVLGFLYLGVCQQHCRIDTQASPSTKIGE